MTFANKTVGPSYMTPTDYYKKHIVKVLNDVCYYDGEQIGTYTGYTMPTSYRSIFIFGMNQNGSNTYRSMTKLYSLKIYGHNNSLIANFIPCYRKADNEIGLYNIVTEEFRPNGNAGTFLKGPDVNPTIQERLNYLSDTKDLIKDALIYKGQTVTENDTFRSYVDKTDAIQVADDTDWTAIGYNHREPQALINNGFEYAQEIITNWENEADLTERFIDDRKLEYMPLVNTSNATNMKRNV